MNRDHVLLAVGDLRFWLNSLHKAATQWESTTAILTLDLLDRISGLDVDADDRYGATLALTKEVETLEAELQRLRRRGDISRAGEREEILGERLKVLEKKLAALRDLSNGLDWIVSSDRAVHAAPASADVPDITDLEAKVRDEGMPEEEPREIWSRMLAMAVVVSEKSSLLREEVHKVEAVAESMEDLDWEPDEAPLTVMLRFS